MSYAETVLPEFDQEMANTAQGARTDSGRQARLAASSQVSHDRLERQSPGEIFPIGW